MAGSLTQAGKPRAVHFTQVIPAGPGQVWVVGTQMAFSYVDGIYAAAWRICVP